MGVFALAGRFWDPLDIVLRKDRFAVRVMKAL